MALALAFQAPMVMNFKLVEFTVDPEQMSIPPEIGTVICLSCGSNSSGKKEELLRQLLCCSH